MAEIDLIPRAYRHALWLRAGLQRCAIACVAVLLSLVAIREGLAHASSIHQRRLTDLRAVDALANTHSLRQQELEAERGRLSEQSELLAVLRGGVAALQMFPAVDRAVDANVWFDEFTFQRAGELVPNEPAAVETGYFVVLPKQPNEEREKAWLMQTHMEIRGRASDHSTLAGFVSRLVRQPEIEQVRVLRTELLAPPAPAAVEFELAVVVRTRP